ncbi:MAG: hypothetical protein WCX86_06755 [Candidatus Hydrogenedentales bacterium]|jgi:putative transposase
MIREHGSKLGIAPLCRALNIPRATIYCRRQRGRAGVQAQLRPKPARALSDKERQEVPDILHAPRFVDLPPEQVHATLLDEGRYVCSARTMYRILNAKGEVREGRDQLKHPLYASLNCWQQVLIKFGRKILPNLKTP